MFIVWISAWAERRRAKEKNIIRISSLMGMEAENTD
jgi:hypothetical protein